MGKDKKLKEVSITPSAEGPKYHAKDWPLLLKVRSSIELWLIEC